MASKTTLVTLHEQEAAARRRLKAVQARRTAMEKREQQQRWMAAGKVVEAVGLPMDCEALQTLLKTVMDKESR